REVSQRTFGCFLGSADFPLGALALGNLLGGDVDRNNFAAWRAQRMPIGDPRAFLGLIRTLPRDLDTDDGFSRLYDRANDLLNGIRERRHAIPDEAPEMIFHRYSANLGEALVDL